MPIRTYLLALSAVAIWASLAVLGIQLSRVPPFLLVGIALTLGSLCGVHRIREWKVPASTLLLGLYGLFGYHFFLFMGLRNAPPVKANLINYLWPLLLIVLSPVFLKGYRLKPKHVVAAILGFSGAFLIVTGGRLAFSSKGMLGYVCAGIAALIWASYSLLSKRVPPFPTSAVGLFCLVSGVAATGCHFILEPRYLPNLHEWTLLILLGLGPMGSAFFLWDASLKEGDPRIIGSLAYLTPMLSTLALIVSGHGALSAVSSVAMLLIVGGAGVGSLNRPKRIKSNQSTL